MPASARTFLHHDGALGDVLLSLPCFSLLRREQSILHFAGRRDVGALLLDAGVVTEASSSDCACYASLYDGKPVPEVHNLFRGFSRACIFTVHPDSAFVTSVRTMVPDTKAVVTVPPAGTPVHAAAFRLAQLGGESADAAGPFLATPPWYQEHAAGMLARAGYEGTRPLIAIHPGSGGRSKCWPLESYFALIERLQNAAEAFVLILTGPAEQGPFKERIENFTRGLHSMAHFADSDLSTVAALLGRCDLYAGNDSGVSHLAAALDRTVIAFFGPTDPGRWKPLGARVHVLRSEKLAELSVDRVYARIAELLSARLRGSPICRRGGKPVLEHDVQD